MHWLWTVLIGFLAGFVAKAVTPGKELSGFVALVAMSKLKDHLAAR